MNPHLKEAFQRQKFRRKVRSLIKQHKSKQQLSEATLYKAFVDPFTDVLQAVNLAGQEFLNSYISFLRLFIAFSPEKHKEIIADHDARTAKIAEKWKPLMDRTDESLSTGDADIVALVAAPHIWAMSAVGQKAFEYGGGVVDFLDGAGLGGLVSIAIPGWTGMSNYNPTKSQGSAGNSGPGGDDSILDKMSNLFLGGVAAAAFVKAAKSSYDKKVANEGLIVEQDKKPSFDEDLKTFMTDNGLIDSGEQDAEEIFNSLKDTIKVFDDELQSKKEVFEKLAAAADLESFDSALEELQKLNEQDDPGANLQKVRSEMEKSVNELMKSEDFKEQVKEETNTDEPTEDQLKKAAEKVIFLDAKQNMEEEIGSFEEATSKYAASIGETVKEMLPSDNALSVLKKSKSKIASDILKFVESAKQQYSIA